MRGQGTRPDASYSGRIAIGLIAVLGVALVLVGGIYKRTGRGAAGVELALMSYTQTFRLATELEKTLTESGRMGGGTQAFLSQAAAELDASLTLFFEADTPVAVAHGPSLQPALKRIRAAEADGNFTDSGQQPWVPTFGDRPDDPRFKKVRGMRVQREYPWAVEAPVGANLTLRQIPLAIRPAGDGGFLSGLVVLFIVMSLISVIVALRLSRPLETTATAFERLASGALHTRIPTAGIRELSWIARGATHIAERIREADSRQKEMLVRVGSLLVEPVSRTRKGLSELDRAAVPPTPRQALESVDSDIDDLHRTVTALWRWAELEAGKTESNVRDVDIRPTFSEVIDLFVQRRAPDLVVEFEVDEDVDESLSMDGRLVAGVVASLLDNARVHGAGPVKVHVSRSHTKIEVAIQDQGPGVPFEQLGDIFEPFRTAGAEEGGQVAEGLGLGLSIARLVLRLQRGGLTARNIPAGGFEVSFWLPAPPIRVSTIDKSLLESVDWINREDERIEVGDAAPAEDPVEDPAAAPKPAAPAPPVEDDFEP